MARAEVREVVTKFVAEDDFTIKVDGMTRSSKELADAAEKARRASGAVGGGRFGGLAGAMGMPAMSFQQFAGMHLAGMGQGMRSFASSGGIVSDLLTAPLRIMSGLARGVGQLGMVASLALGPIGLVVGAIGIVSSLFLDLANVLVAVVGKALEFVGGIAIKVGGVIGAAFVGLMGMAVKTALTFDQLERSFGAFLGSQEKGKQAAAFVEAFGLKSAFEQTALQEAARSLLAVNLSLSQFLPVVEAIALRRGVGSENMMEVARIMMEVAGGATGRAFGPMGLGRFGISRELLEQFGARFDKAGSFQGTPTEALQVLLRLGSSPEFQAIREAFDDSPAVKFSNALDAINKALRDMGGALLPRIVPLVERFADTILRGVNAGIFAEAVGKLAEGFEKLTGIEMKSVQDGINLLVSGIAAAIATLPQVIKATFDLVVAAIQFARFKVEEWLDSIMAHPFMLMAQAYMWAQGLQAKAMHAMLDQFGRGAVGPGKAGGPPSMSGPFSDFQAALDAFSSTMADFRNRLANAPSLEEVADPSAGNKLKDGAGAQGGGGMQGLTGVQSPFQLPGPRDFRRFALGGGDVGRLGLTDVDMAKIGAFGSQPTVKVRVQVVGVGNFEEMFRRLFEQFAREYEEQRVRVLRPSLG